MTDVQQAIADAPPLKVTRWFDAPPTMVFDAWTSADHIREWFSPECFSVPDAVIDARVGGTFDVRMSGPDGFSSWNRGKFVAIDRPTRLELFSEVKDGEGKALFSAKTIATFTEEKGGTRLDVIQIYDFTDPAMAEPALQGAPTGWAQTLDKLEREVARMRG
jgi:uncharacterized protein YndB with AHSA1/START domain